MLDHQIRRYETRIAEEEQLATEAGSSEGALAHLQAAMNYKSELAILLEKRAAHLSALLARIW
jgi:hypothetical protein